MSTKKKVETQRSAYNIAVLLLDVRTAKKNADVLEKALTADLKKAMKEEQLTEVGNFEISVSRSLSIADEKIARPWAVEHLCMVPEKIDTSKAKEILRHTFDDPSKFGFAVVESERIVPKGKVQDQE